MGSSPPKLGKSQIFCKKFKKKTNDYLFAIRKKFVHIFCFVFLHAIDREDLEKQQEREIFLLSFSLSFFFF